MQVGPIEQGRVGGLGTAFELRLTLLSAQVTKEDETEHQKAISSESAESGSKRKHSLVSFERRYQKIAISPILTVETPGVKNRFEIVAKPWNIASTRSHGCIRVGNERIAFLVGRVPLVTSVVIH